MPRKAGQCCGTTAKIIKITDSQTYNGVYTFLTTHGTLQQSKTTAREAKKYYRETINNIFRRYIIVANSINTTTAFMRKHIRMTLLCVALALANRAEAQYDVLFSHYYDMEPSFNPAAVGKETVININAAYAMDLAGFEHNPQTAYIAADMPFNFLNTLHGAGLLLMDDKLGLFDHKRISLQYAKKITVLKGTLSVGLQAGLLVEQFDGTKLDVEDSSDPAFATSSVNGNAFDLGAGLYYTLKDFYAGVSAQHLTAPTVALGETNELKISASYYLTAGYTFKLRNPYLRLKTSAIGRTDGNAYRADITGRLLYTHEKKMFYGGLSYSPTNSVTFLLGMNFHGVIVSYGYECYTSGINPGNGSHELAVAYKMPLNIVKKGKNIHKSVRIL